MLLVPEYAGPGGYLQRMLCITCFKDRNFNECIGINIVMMT